VPKRLTGKSVVAIQREEIVARSTDLVENDPNVSGVVDNSAATVVGTETGAGRSKEGRAAERDLQDTPYRR